MRLTLGQKLALARSEPGRRRLGLLALGRLAVPLRRVAWLHRRTLARGVRVVAVTGSYGKSSTVRLVAAALGLPPPAAGEIPNGLWPVPAAVLRLRPGQARAVIEIGIDRPGLMDRQAGAAAPDVAIVTSVGGEHLETIGDLGRIAREKARLLAHLRRGGVAVLHGDDPRVRAMAPRAEGAVVTYGLDPGNDVHAVNVSVDWPRGMRFTAMVHGAAVPVRLPLLGRHMVPPALAALAVAAGEGLPLAQAAAAIAALPPVEARLEVVPLPDGTTLLCDHHKNSLTTVRAALELAAELPGRKLLVIARVREMGAEQADELRRTAELVARVPAAVIAIGDGVELLIESALAAGLPPARLHHAAPGTAHALAILRALARPGDVILLKARIAWKLERLILALQGRRVVCDLGECTLLGQDCATCPLLETGAGGG